MTRRSNLKNIVIIALSDATENVDGIIEALKKHGYVCHSYENNLSLLPFGKDKLVVSSKTHQVQGIDEFIDNVSKVLVFASPNLGKDESAQILINLAASKSKLAPIIICDYSITLHQVNPSKNISNLALDTNPEIQIRQILSVL